MQRMTSVQQNIFTRLFSFFIRKLQHSSFGFMRNEMISKLRSDRIPRIFQYFKDSPSIPGEQGKIHCCRLLKLKLWRGIGMLNASQIEHSHVSGVRSQLRLNLNVIMLTLKLLSADFDCLYGLHEKWLQNLLDKSNCKTSHISGEHPCCAHFIWSINRFHSSKHIIHPTEKHIYLQRRHFLWWGDRTVA